MIASDHSRQYDEDQSPCRYQVVPSSRVPALGSGVSRNCPPSDTRNPCRWGGSTRREGGDMGRQRMFDIHACTGECGILAENPGHRHTPLFSYFDRQGFSQLEAGQIGSEAVVHTTAERLDRRGTFASDVETIRVLVDGGIPVSRPVLTITIVPEGI